MHPTSARLLAWYRANARDLPWRRSRDPYRIWLSEIMLQQTRVEAVIPYFHRFLDRFPTVQDLAAASEQDVLGLWSGLGYYRRARYLHRAAQRVAEQGAFPDTARGLRELPGVGAYTAAAVASIAFGRDELAVDGNLRRVVARLAAVEQPPDRGEGARAVRRHLDILLPQGRAGDFNQALMDLGATVCIPSTPRCPACPLAQDCRARAEGRQEVLPVRVPRKAPRVVKAVALVLTDGVATFLVQRPSGGLLAGLWGPPERVQGEGEEERDCLRLLLEDLAVPAGLLAVQAGELEHVFTHQRWRVAVYQARLPPRTLAGHWWRAGTEPPPLSRLAERILALAGACQPEDGCQSPGSLRSSHASQVSSAAASSDSMAISTRQGRSREVRG
jgi:A/G-specific adenine glycosylase